MWGNVTKYPVMENGKNILNRNYSDNDLRGLAVFTLLSIFLLDIQKPPDVKGLILTSNLVLSFVAGLIGRKRKIGFGKAYFVSLIFTGIVGCIAALSSERIE